MYLCVLLAEREPVTWALLKPASNCHYYQYYYINYHKLLSGQNEKM